MEPQNSVKAARGTGAATLSAFIRTHSERIIEEWETFARALPMGPSMDVAALRDHAKAMLGVIARDLETPQSDRQQHEKARGEADTDERVSPTAAGEHGSGRAESGFTVEAMVSEFRALRASVIRLWTAEQDTVGTPELEELIRFNEAIDQAIAESLARYTHDISQTKERFLAILGHDLRTPLGAILMSSQFLLDTATLQESERTLVTGILRSSRRMNEMVSDLLDFALTRFGDSIPVVRAPVDLDKLLRDVTAEVTATYPRSSLHVETTGELRGEWDADRLSQAMTNLIGNAVEHGAEGAPVGIAARNHDGEVLIAIHNEGPPIPRDEVRRMFEPMRRGAATPRDRRHLGLGLYIVDRIVKAHGGTVDVESSQAGTTFTVCLPRKEMPAG